MTPMFYFLLSLTFRLAVTSSQGQPVLDINGDMIFNGSYYIIPLNYGTAGGGLTLSPRGDSLCPLFVGQRTSEVNKGIPVKFSNWRSSKVPFVPQSENLNIEMDVKATICAKSTYWWVTAAERHFRKLFVTVGPKPERGDSSKSFFQIKKTGVLVNGYTIAFCSKDNGCSDVGIYVDEHGIRRLVLGSMPFPIVFMKATEEETAPTMSII